MMQLRWLILVGSVIFSVVPSACSSPPVDHPNSAAPIRNEQPAFVGKIWISTDSSAASGTLRLFLPDGTMVMTSCVETYRLARWASIGAGRIVWQEDAARIEAEIVRATADELQLRLRLVNELKEEHYRLAQVPYVCPDMRASSATPDPVSRARGSIRNVLPPSARVRVELRETS